MFVRKNYAPTTLPRIPSVATALSWKSLRLPITERMSVDDVDELVERTRTIESCTYKHQDSSGKIYDNDILGIRLCFP